jgi:hypothetical protein
VFVVFAEAVDLLMGAGGTAPSTRSARRIGGAMISVVPSVDEPFSREAPQHEGQIRASLPPNSHNNRYREAQRTIRPSSPVKVLLLDMRINVEMSRCSTLSVVSSRSLSRREVRSGLHRRRGGLHRRQAHRAEVRACHGDRRRGEKRRRPASISLYTSDLVFMNQPAFRLASLENSSKSALTSCFRVAGRPCGAAL